MMFLTHTESEKHWKKKQNKTKNNNNKKKTPDVTKINKNEALHSLCIIFV